MPVAVGGGGGSDEDTTAPYPGTADSPEYSNGPTIPVTYSGAYDSGGSGLSNVNLLVKKGTGSWQNTSYTSAGASGTFEFVPDASLNANYYFDLQAFDNDGNVSDWPSGGSGDTQTIYDIQAPTIDSITVPATASATPITISYQGAADVGIAGLDHVEFWYKKGVDGTWTDAGQTKTAANDSFGFEPDGGSGFYYVDLIAVDRAGNESEETEENDNPIVFDVDPPVVGTVSAEETTGTLPIDITYTDAIDVGPAGLDHVELWFKKEETGVWTNSLLTSESSDDVFEFMAAQEGGTYYFDLVMEDSFGNRSEAASMNGLIEVEYSPQVVTQPTPPTALLSNLPEAETMLTGANITVGGDEVVAYRYKLDAGNYGSETALGSPIALSDLSIGQHSLSVIGRNAEGLWQSSVSPTTYSWNILYGSAPEPPDTSHCENDIIDADELNVDCGGSDCPACIDVILQVLAQPMGRPVDVYGTEGSVHLYTSATQSLLRSAEIEISDTGQGQALITQIPPHTYDVALKGDAYLQRIISNVLLQENNSTALLDYTFGGTFLLIGGDVYNDNIINSFDLAFMLKNYQTVDPLLDMNRDGLANAADLAMILKNYRQVGDSL